MITLHLTEAQAKELRSILYREVDYYKREIGEVVPTAQLLTEQIYKMLLEAHDGGE